MCKKLTYLSSFVLVLGLVLNGVAEEVDPSLVGWWKFEEGSGGTAYDSSDYGNDGTIQGDPKWVPGYIDWVPGYLGGAIQLDGVDDYIDCGNDASVNITNQITLAAWVKTNDSGNSERKPYIRKGGPSYVLNHENNNSINLEIRGDSGWSSVAFPVDSSFNGVWHHLAGTYDGSQLKLYIDGRLEATTASTGPISICDYNVNIGRNSKETSAPKFNGLIDDVRIYSRALTEGEIHQVIIPTLAFNPNPANGATDVPRDVILSWSPGGYVEGASPKHRIFFSDSFDDVNNGSAVAMVATQDPNYYPVSGKLRLVIGRTYHWRVDEANIPSSSWEQGNVWSFTVEPIAYPLTSEKITATASSSAPDKGPENTINGSGLDDSGLLHAKTGDGTMWLSDLTGVQPTWIKYEFDKVYKLNEMWVWNYNDSLEPMIGFGFKDVSIEYSVNGIDYQTLDTAHEFAQAPGQTNYAHNTIIDLGGVPAKYVKLTANSNWGGILDQYGLSEVRFFYISVYAREPDPDSGATDISIGTIDKPIDVTLGFRAGREAAKHEVYLSTDEQAVIDGTAAVTTVTDARYGPLSLDLGNTYYWRIDEVNEAETPATWQGDIWNFTIQEYFVLDDFEDYNDFPPDEIYSTWQDGWNDPANGSQVGYLNAPYAEQAVVHGGNQAMPYFYDNSSGYSEATMMLSSQRRDWTMRGIGSLSLWFRGYPASVGSFTEAPAGTYTMTAAGSDIWGTSDQFHFAYKQITGPGSITAKVESVEQTHSWAKAGVMIRDTLEADSVHAMMVVTPVAGINFERRTEAGGSTTRTRKNGITAPYWVKIERDISGSVNANYSADGSTWTQLGAGSELITMNTPMYIGLALTAHNANATCEAVFSNVQITGTVSPQWMNQDIGILSNDPEPMYVALANSDGKVAVVYNDDPNATQVNAWTEWSINLDRFAGVNLTDLDKLSIGLGDRDNLQPGSSGKMCFDDIRLYPFREP